MGTTGRIAALVFALLVAALGWGIVTDFRGFATWHRQRAQASTPAALRRVSDKVSGRERTDRAVVVVQKIVGCGFTAVGAGMFLVTLHDLLFG
ncbi:hypothetical protein J5Y04_02640 [Kitasatospora sp. RG8]|uniref:hypothetical protein n=1 Tax=Kitasatospora sp. RG8 TaxID=2820815 RepID=UPI001AE0810A|nr:hypothetical protein [Kitasatospora sp. RG8]MBP0448450.1 hypothetical protein [Kitasatospora sp. RG8]